MFSSQQLAQGVRFGGEMMEAFGRLFQGGPKTGVVGETSQALGWYARRLVGSIGDVASAGAARGMAVGGRIGNPVAAGKRAGGWLATPSVSRHLAFGAVGAAYGYRTSTSDDPAQRWGRAVGFGIGGAYLSSRVLSGAGLAGMRRAAGGLRGEMEWERVMPGGGIRHYSMSGGRVQVIGSGGWNNTMSAAGMGKIRGREFMGGIREAFNMPAKWTPMHSIVAGAMYGLISDKATVYGGATAGLMMDLGVRGVGRQYPAMKERIGAISGTMAEGAPHGAFRKNIARMPLAALGAYGGLGLGAYGAMQAGAGPLGVIGGGLGEGAKLGLMGGAAKLTFAHPILTVAAAAATVPPAIAAMQAQQEVAQAGYPGVNSMHADGDLALALFRMRHG